MTVSRDNLLDKIRALLAKTTENGCTEAEALAALAKARAMMDAYEVTEADLALTKEEAAILLKEPPESKDPHGIKSYMARAIAKFADCKVWRSGSGLTYCGLRSDVQFAAWLTDTLCGFVQGELVNHLADNIVPGHNRRAVINGFVAGCTRRISERLDELCAQSAQVATSNGRALVVVKSTAIAEKMKSMGIVLGKARGSRRTMDGQSYQAGRSAGERASFGRPVSGSGATLRLN